MQTADIIVSPDGDGWSVAGGALDAPLWFATGATAERKGDSLARALAKSGAHARLIVLDRSRRLAGARRFDPSPVEA